MTRYSLVIREVAFIMWSALILNGRGGEFFCNFQGGASIIARLASKGVNNAHLVVLLHGIIAKKRWDILFGGKGVFENKFLKNYGGKI